MHNEILYIHGLFSSGETGRVLERLVDEEYGLKVHHFHIPENYNEAYPLVKKYLKDHPRIGILIGSSLGGFLTLQIPGYMKIVINPCLEPSKQIVKLGATQEMADSYIEQEKIWKRNIDPEERLSTYGFFSTDDELFRYRPVFEKLFLKDHVHSVEGGHHHLNEEELDEYIVPFIERVVNEGRPMLEHYIQCMENIYDF